MIGKLRRKFVLINMALVALVLLAVFSVVTISSYQQQRREGDGAMYLALNRELGKSPDRFQIGKGKPPQEMPTGLQPVFTVTLHDDGTLESLDAGFVEVSDEVVASAVEQAVQTGKTEGTLSQLNLRFIRETNYHGDRIAFLDCSMEQASMTRLVITLLLVWVGALALFFVISLFLANWALRPVQRAWAQQQQFIGDASHELKTPLTVILANQGILLAHGSETVDSQQKWIENTQVEATRMKKLVDDMLFLARSDEAVVPRERAEFSVSDVVWRSVLAFEPVAFEQGLSMHSDIEPDIGMVGDESQLLQLVTILLDNACKYAGEHGEVYVTLARAQDRMKLVVTNTGEAIPPEALAHVFERFYRADKARARMQGGYGLGLSIAAEIVRQHGGKITAASDARLGTSFTASMPLGVHHKG